ncbi:MAG: (Fe-S)-binding protein [Planctomycetota bacterium]
MELQKEIERCAKCGQCRSVCPVFLALKDETLVARGRLAIIQAKHQAPQDTYDLYTKILNTCLMCRRCEENCPSMVKTEEIFKSQRLSIAKENGLPLLLRFGFRWVLPYRWFYNIILRSTYLLQRLIKNRRASPPEADLPQAQGSKEKTASDVPVRHLPLYFANLFQRLPKLAPKSALEYCVQRTTHNEQRTTAPVAIFIGCAANYIYPEIINQITAILKHHKVPYTIPSQQVCCGFPALLSGDEEAANKLMKINLKNFDADTIITVCPTCNRMLREQYYLNNKQVKVIDAFEFINELTDIKPQTPKTKLCTTYHLPCHSVGTKLPDIIKSSLKATTDYHETESDLCCGGGGLFSFKYPELSHQIGQVRLKSLLESKEHRAKSIENTTPLRSTLHAPRSTLMVVTNCPGCMMQLDYLISAGDIKDVKVCHPLNLYSPST